MKTIIFLFIIVILILSCFLVSCRNEEIPILTTTEIARITETSVLCWGNIINDGGAGITSRGVCWNSNGNPTVASVRTSDGTGPGLFVSILTQLLPNTHYYLRAYATNSAGTGYGNELSFTTHNITTGSVTDLDGNTCKIVMIGAQIWMAENLKTTRYNDNTSIPPVTGNMEWSSLSSAAYCWYNNDASTNKSTYGALYNYYAVATRKLCPSGWHVPTYAQWSEMINYLGGESVVADKLKEAGETHWIRPNAGATNESGFTALPGGGRINGTFDFIGLACAWWAATSYDAGNAWSLELDDDKVYLIKGYVSKSQGYSVRCIKD
ncbi:MAG TPA: hypothetical protein DDY34_14545 [Bacteroidales bacterium]|nr:MAG: hypothetical protein A2X06_03370 [Bacteroidetes bacterium GWC2_40_22]HBH85000.1 hypothetical protein [Bacteroidales bacterium]HBQ83294.1 hypothetical protein [Bacteroidales bacterium]